MEEFFEDTEIIEQITENGKGYSIKTNKQIIEFNLNPESDCCESAGYLFSYDNPRDFIGAELIKIEIVDDSLDKKQLMKEDFNEQDLNNLIVEEKIIFVFFETDRGTFQLTAYNSHNGFYGHDVTIKSLQLNHLQTL